MVEKLRDVLVTDRTQKDVNRAKYLRSLYDSKSIWHGTEEEWKELNESHGMYTCADLNRVLRACSWLAKKLEYYGYIVPIDFFPAVLVHVTVRPRNSGKANSVLAYKGEIASVQAVVSDNRFEFNHWEENGQIVSKEEIYSFTATEDRNLAAVFDVPPEEESGVVGRAVAGRAVAGKGLV